MNRAGIAMESEDDVRCPGEELTKWLFVHSVRMHIRRP